ncbi:hypothetical protein J6590_036214 [Homalodisca vitripennis]|nr:hypothetical protein J6590_036214 [Homalodisca vitripennis]
MRREGVPVGVSWGRVLCPVLSRLAQCSIITVPVKHHREVVTAGLQRVQAESCVLGQGCAERGVPVGVSWGRVPCPVLSRPRMRREGRSGGCILGPGAVSCPVTAKDAQRGAFRWVYPGAGCRVLSCQCRHVVACVTQSDLQIPSAVGRAWE